MFCWPEYTAVPTQDLTGYSLPKGYSNAGIEIMRKGSMAYFGIGDRRLYPSRITVSITTHPDKTIHFTHEVVASSRNRI
jgi:hypothetical protein